MIFNFADIDLAAKGELYHTLYNKIKQACIEGSLKKGERLPSIREAAELLRVSRTTVENAYIRLCIEGYAESFPQKGYYITGSSSSYKKPQKQINLQDNVKFDFSSRKIDTLAADTDTWKKKVRAVLCDSGELTSYGDPQGETGLRTALADYSFKARGVKTNAENIIVGAGIGPLLNILCSLLGRDIHVGFENGGFDTAHNIFGDYDIKCTLLNCDANGVKVDSLTQNNIDLLFLMPSALSKISIPSLSKRRNRYCEWVNAKAERIIIEDDYNGELRYTARSVPAFQSKAPEKTVYIGSFSKLLLPSVRIAYMVLPDFLALKFNEKRNTYNQTCGKIEQLALEQYILSGALEKHLRRLRRLYYAKSQLLYNSLLEKVSQIKKLTLFESSLTIEVETTLDLESRKICDYFLKRGIKVMESTLKGSIKLCFAGIRQDDIPYAVEELAEGFNNLA